MLQGTKRRSLNKILMKFGFTRVSTKLRQPNNKRVTMLNDFDDTGCFSAVYSIHDNLVVSTTSQHLALISVQVLMN